MRDSKATSDKVFGCTPKTMLLNRKMVVSESFYAIFGTKLPIFSPLRNGIFGLRNHACDNWDN